MSNFIDSHLLSVVLSVALVVAAYDVIRTIINERRQETYRLRFIRAFNRHFVGTHEEMLQIDGVRDVQPGSPGEIVVTCAWWSSPIRVQNEAEYIAPVQCVLTIRRETVAEWWNRENV